MRKLLVISNDLDSGKPRGPHTLRKEHEASLRTAAAGMQVVFASPEDAPGHFADAEVIAAFPTRFPDVSQTPNVRWLHSFSAGVDKILTPQVIESDIIVSNSSGIHATPIAEHIIGFMLMFTRSFHTAVRAQEKHFWQKDAPLDEVRGKNILIVGLGEIGKETARLAEGFGAHVSAISRSGKHKPEFVERLETSEKLDSLLPEADFVVITLPGTQETNHLFDKKKFVLMSAQGRSASGGKKFGPYIINIGRGSIIKESDLVEALENKTIAGAALDVFEQEPLPKESPLWDMEQVIITPHYSGISQKYMDRAVELLCKNIEAYLASEKLPTEVDKKLGY